MKHGDKETRPHRLVWTLLFACSSALFAASVYRAATYSFTGDESLSYAGFTYAPIWTDDANNHLLNTWLMRFCSALFGDSELSLRLPNVLAHLVYLASVLALLRRFGHTALVFSGFALFNLNPFLLDFFSLARGYGLALAFTAASLYLLARAHEAKRQARGFGLPLHLAAAAGALAVLSNYAFLNFFLPLLLACAWLLLTDPQTRRPARGRLLSLAALLAASGAFLAFVLSELFRLRGIGALYAGGREGFVSDTVKSLVRASLYSVPYTHVNEAAVSAFLVGLFVALLLLGVGLLVTRREVGLFGPLLLMLAAAVALPLAQHRLLGTLFPLDRAALPYAPLYAAVLLSASHLLWGLAGRRRAWAAAALALPALLAALLVWHFSRGFNPHSCYLWWFHAHDREVIELVERDRARHFPGRTVRLANSWMMEPSLNFYRYTRGYDWLEPPTRKPLAEAGGDYVYAFASEVKTLEGAGHTVLATFPDTQTVLLRAERPRAKLFGGRSE